jgi:hypothetical protein
MFYETGFTSYKTVNYMNIKNSFMRFVAAKFTTSL